MSAHSRQRSGIALVIVLGFLALLTILVVAFAIMMRTERVAAKNYNDSVRAKQLVRVGLARAQVVLDDQLGGYPPQAMVPLWGSTNSVGVTLTTNFTAPLLVRGETCEATNFFPGAVLEQALYSSRVAGWSNIVIKDENNQDKLVGRVAYIIADCSGLLDANFAGGRTRAEGSAPAELATDSVTLPELNNGNNFPQERLSTYKRYESLADLKVCAMEGLDIAPTRHISNLFVYSRSPRGAFRNGMVTNPVVVAGPYASLVTNQPAIQEAFRRSLIAGGDTPTPAELGELTKNLLDYVDTTEQGPDVDSFRTENVPMINEIVITGVSEVVAGPGGGNRYTFQTRVEVWYPFVGPANAKQYTLDIGVRFSGATPASYNPAPVAVANVDIPTPPGGWTTNKFMVIGAGLIPAAVVTDPALPTSFAGMRAEVRAGIKEKGVNAYQDMVGSAAKGFLVLPMDFVSTAVPGTFYGGKACDDPRFNYATANPQMWKRVGKMGDPGVIAPASLSNENVGVVTYSTVATADGTNLMYVRNGPMTNTGELGYLAYSESKPWHTIRLLEQSGAAAHQVLDYFTVLTNEITRGLVNPNSAQRDVLVSVLRSAWTNFNPELCNGLTDAEARRLADGIFAAGPYTNRADMARVGTPAYNGFWPAQMTKIQREALMRHTADLFSPRQSVYTVLVAAQAIRRPPNKPLADPVDDAIEVVAEQRAVAVVWRDPYPVADPTYPDHTHPQIVTFFKWLTE